MRSNQPNRVSLFSSSITTSVEKNCMGSLTACNFSTLLLVCLYKNPQVQYKLKITLQKHFLSYFNIICIWAICFFYKHCSRPPLSFDIVFWSDLVLSLFPELHNKTTSNNQHLWSHSLWLYTSLFASKLLYILEDTSFTRLLRHFFVTIVLFVGSVE